MTHSEIISVGPVNVLSGSNPQWTELISRHHDRIEELWLDAQRTRQGLYNGSLLNLLDVQHNGKSANVTGYFVEYKHFLAERHDGTVRLNIRPVAVSGIIVLKEHSRRYVVFGKRSSLTTQYPGFWEMVPSGSIDKHCENPDGTIDYKKKIMEEFVEETILPADCVKKATAFAFIADKREIVYNVCCELQVEGIQTDGLYKEFIRAADEYDNRAAMVDVDELDDFVKSYHQRIAPTSLVMITAWQKWRKESPDELH